jgi:hypothetical protein
VVISTASRDRWVADGHKRIDGKGQKAAGADLAGGATRSTRDRRTQRDPFGNAWNVEVVPLLKQG